MSVRRSNYRRVEKRRAVTADERQHSLNPSRPLFKEQARRIAEGQTDFYRRLLAGALSFRPASRFDKVRGLFLSRDDSFEATAAPADS